MEKKGKEPAMEGKILEGKKEEREGLEEKERVLNQRKRKVEEASSVEEDSYIGKLGRMLKEKGMVKHWGMTKKRSPGFSRVISGVRATDIIVELLEATVGPRPARLISLLADGQIKRLSGPFEKKLTKSDVDKGLARLLIPGDNVKTNMKPVVWEAAGDKLTFYDGEDREYKFTYSKWKIGNVFQGDWKKFIQDNNLKENDSVKIWVLEYSASTPTQFGGIILPTKKD